MQHLNAPHLNILDISEAFQFNINCATKLATLTNLQYLDVGGVEIRGKSWNAIDFSKFTKLLHLNLEKCVNFYLYELCISALHCE